MAKQYHNDAAVAHAEHSGPSVRKYVQIFVVLFVATALEVATTFLTGIVPNWTIIAILLTIATFKGVLVVMFYMHLRFDSRWFTFLFASGTGIALFMVLAFIGLFSYHLGLE